MPKNDNATGDIVQGDLHWSHEFATARDHARQHNGNHYGNIIYNFYGSETPFSHSFPAAANPDRAQSRRTAESKQVAVSKQVDESRKVAEQGKIVGVVKVDYDFHSQERDELQVVEGDVLLVLDKTTSSEWWHCQKLLSVLDTAREPVGAIPSSYVSQLDPPQNAIADFDYQRQTEEELTMNEGDTLEVFDVRDPDWTLVGFHGAYGFLPANYILLQPPENLALESKRDSRK